MIVTGEHFQQEPAPLEHSMIELHAWCTNTRSG